MRTRRAWRRSYRHVLTAKHRAESLQVDALVAQSSHGCSATSSPTCRRSNSRRRYPSHREPATTQSCASSTYAALPRRHSQRFIPLAIACCASAMPRSSRVVFSTTCCKTVRHGARQHTLLQMHYAVLFQPIPGPRSFLHSIGFHCVVTLGSPPAPRRLAVPAAPLAGKAFSSAAQSQ